MFSECAFGKYAAVVLQSDEFMLIFSFVLLQTRAYPFDY